VTEQVPSDTSDTPKTDAAIVRIKIEGEAFTGEQLVRADFARAQERRIAELEKVCSDIADFISGHDGHVFDDIAIALLGTKP
jgi:hypothetical protein